MSIDVGDLVDAASVRRRPRSPLRAIDRAEIAIGVGPFVPDRDAVVPEIFDVGVAFEKPQQLVHDRLQRQLLGCQHRKSGGQIEAHLMAEDRQRAGSGAVVFLRAVGEDSFEQIVILIHDVTYEPSVQGQLTPDLPSTAPIRAGRSDYSRKNEYWAVRGQAQRWDSLPAARLRSGFRFHENLVPLAPQRGQDRKHQQESGGGHQPGRQRPGQEYRPVSA